MAATSYNYTKFVNVLRLKKEILANPAITIGLSSVLANGSALTLTFKDALPAEQKTELDTVVTATVNEPLPGAPEPKTSKGIPKVAVYDAEGNSTSLPSHDWTDPTTWYQGSSRVLGEVLAVSNFQASLVNKSIIDVTNGKVTYEDEISPSYGLVVYDDGNPLVEHKDYSVDYLEGILTLDNAPAGVVTVDYSYSQGSTFTVKVPAGLSEYKIIDAEIQFTSDIQMKSSFVFEVWLNHPQAGWVPAFRKVYKSLKDIINVARAGKGSIPRVGTLSHNVLVFPIKYDKKIVLTSEPELELRVSSENDLPMQGEWGTITFYVESDE